MKANSFKGFWGSEFVSSFQALSKLLFPYDVDDRQYLYWFAKKWFASSHFEANKSLIIWSQDSQTHPPHAGSWWWCWKRSWWDSASYSKAQVRWDLSSNPKRSPKAVGWSEKPNKKKKKKRAKLVYHLVKCARGHKTAETERRLIGPNKGALMFKLSWNLLLYKN